jgi:hypothetical protein
MNYLARLKAIESKLPYPPKPSKGSKPPFEGFEGDPTQGNLRNAGSPAPTLTPGVAEDEQTNPERASIIEEGSGAPRLWSEAYAALCWTRRAPEGVSEDDWALIKNRAGRFLDKLSVKATRLGWSPPEILSVDVSSPMYRAFALGEALDVTTGSVVFGIDGRKVAYGRDGRPLQHRGAV